MKCLCCGKEINEPMTAAERSNCWHAACVKRFFGTTEFPALDLSDDALLDLAVRDTSKGLTVPGVQKKLSLHLSHEGRKPRLTLVNYPTGYILKPVSDDYPALPESEHLVMLMAARSGISVVPHALIRMSTGDDPVRYAYITRRVDRVFHKRMDAPEMLAMEDFCQLDLRLTEDKYRGSYERCAKVIERYSSRPGLDLSELFLRIVFSFAIGNSDMHLKNWSLIETAPGSQQYVLSAAYDLLPVNVILPEDPEQLALTLNGKKRNIHRNDFLRYADSVGIADAAAKKMLGRISSMQDTYLAMCEESFLPEEMKARIMGLVRERIRAVAGEGI